MRDMESPSHGSENLAARPDPRATTRTPMGETRRDRNVGRRRRSRLLSFNYGGATLPVVARAGLDGGSAWETPCAMTLSCALDSYRSASTATVTVTPGTRQRGLRLVRRLRRSECRSTRRPHPPLPHPHPSGRHPSTDVPLWFAVAGHLIADSILAPVIGTAVNQPFPGGSSADAPPEVPGHTSAGRLDFSWPPSPVPRSTSATCSSARSSPAKPSGADGSSAPPNPKTREGDPPSMALSMKGTNYAHPSQGRRPVIRAADAIVARASRSDSPVPRAASTSGSTSAGPMSFS